jgi:tetratricopeptide (TPR) repeat protein
VKIRKKDIQAARAPDAVFTGATSLFDWIYERRTPLGIAFAAVLVAVGAANWVKSASAGKRDALGATLAQAADETSRPIIEKPAEPEEGAEKIPSYPTKADKQKAVTEAMSAIVDKSGDTAPGRVSALDLAQLRAADGKYDEAISLAQKYIENPDGAQLQLFAWELIGTSAQAKKDWAKADEAYKKMAEAGAPARGLYLQARLQQLQGKTDEARKLYQKVNTDFEKDPVAAEARVQLDMLDVPPEGKGALASASEPQAPAADQKKKDSGLKITPHITPKK